MLASLITTTLFAKVGKGTLLGSLSICSTTQVQGNESMLTCMRNCKQRR